MKKLLTVLMASCLLITTSAFAEDINDIFKRVNDLIAQQNYSKALNELNWASKEIEKMHNQKLQGFLPDTLSGLAGGKIESTSALGFTNLERTYTNAADKSTVKVSLSGGTTPGAQGGMGGLAQLGQMAAMFGGNQPGQDTFRIGGRTATLEQNEQSKHAELTVFMDSGSILKLEMNGNAKGDTLKTMAEALKLDDLDKYLRGNV